MAGRKSDFTLTKLDDLFSTQEQRDEEKQENAKQIRKNIAKRKILNK